MASAVKSAPRMTRSSGSNNNSTSTDVKRSAPPSNPGRSTPGNQRPSAPTPRADSTQISNSNVIEEKPSQAGSKVADNLNWGQITVPVGGSILGSTDNDTLILNNRDAIEKRNNFDDFNKIPPGPVWVPMAN